MSLIHWWPLNGNTKDYGLHSADLTNNNATINNNGKIGKTYRYNGGVMVTNNNDLTSTTTNMTIAGWVYLNSGNYAYVFSCRQGTGGPGLFISLETSCSIFDDGTRWRATYCIPLNTWVHFAFTRDSTGKKLYINGVLHSQTSTLGNLGSIHNKMYIGRNYYNDTASTSSDVMINDFRIYDHALSLKEVKEISKGLVLHYNFEDEYAEGTTNLCNNITPSRYSGWSTLTATKLSDNNYRIKNTHSGATQSYWDSWGYDVSAYIGQKITFSFTVKNMTSSNATTSWIDIGQANSGQYPNHVESSGAGNFIHYSNETANNQRLSWTGTIQSPGRVLMEIWTVNSAANGYSQLDLCDIQVEVKDHATPYVNGTRSNGLIYDNSGLGNNGTINGNLQIVGNSGSGKNTSYIDNGVSTYISNSNFIWPRDAITINFWWKSTNKTPVGDYHIPISSNASGYYEISIYKNGSFRGGLYINGSRYVDNGTTTKLLDGNWHMCSMTYNGTTIKRYVDGVSEKDTSITGTLSGATGFIFGHYGTNTSYAVKEGYIADVKIYATALSAADILAEYQRKAAIDRNGSLYSGQFIENGNSEELLWTQVAADAISYRQSGSADRITTDADGSVVFTTKVWAKSPMIPVTAGERLYYDITYSNVSGNQFYVGFEQYNANGGSGSNEGCVYVISGDTSARDHRRVKGYITVSATAASSPTTQIRLRVLNDWSSTSNTHIAKIHSISLRRISSIASPKITKTSCFIANDFRENDYNGKVSEYANGFVESTELIEN